MVDAAMDDHDIRAEEFSGQADALV